jgi:hypothetical protein
MSIRKICLASSLAAATLVVGCADTLVPSIDRADLHQIDAGSQQDAAYRADAGAAYDAGSAGDASCGTTNLDAGEPPDSECLKATLYQVEGDSLTYVADNSSPLSRVTTQGSCLGTLADIGLCLYVDVDPATGLGRIWLQEDQEELAAFQIDQAFLDSDGLSVLSYRDPSGDLFESHTYYRRGCYQPLEPQRDQTRTRAEIEALESDRSFHPLP